MNNTTYTIRVIEPEEIAEVDFEYWDEIILWCLEQFGNKGTRFTTTANSHYMEFTFKDSRDALLFSLRWT